MKRAIVTPAVLPASALAELKQWLGISTTYDDALLSVLLRAALDMCEAFTGLMPIEATCEEVLAARSGWLCLSTMPVQTISSVDAVAQDGTRAPLAPDAYELNLYADGGGQVRLLKRGNTTRIAVGFTAGVAPDWDTLPEALRQRLLFEWGYKR
ncbi:MAG: phage head-tail connector protein, partial [Sphingomonadaceae bacterium]|nr:phage head-tail connector protein [Sphingomonadaceae bacterium]